MPEVHRLICKAHHPSNMSISVALESLALLGKCVGMWGEGSTSEPPNKAEHPWTREHPACNLERPLATNFITQQSGRLWSSVATGPKVALLWGLAIAKERVHFQMTISAQPVAMAFRAHDKLFWEEKTAVHAVAATLEMSSLLHFFSVFTFVVLDCPQLVWGEHSVALFYFSHFFQGS